MQVRTPPLSPLHQVSDTSRGLRLTAGLQNLAQVGPWIAAILIYAGQKGQKSLELNTLGNPASFLAEGPVDTWALSRQDALLW